MTDLNDWQLDYSGVSFSFGTFATGFPLLRQVDVGTVESVFTDAAHPSADGTIMGAEKYAGRTLTFEVAVPRVAGVGNRWPDGLAGQDAFAAAWDADAVRKVVGAVATLSNLDRGRLVFGRPRNLKPRLERVRRGWSELVADFKTADARFYGTTYRSATPSGGSILAQNYGNRPTWFRWEVVGPATDPWLSFGGAGSWQVQVAGTIAAGQTLVVDSAPWSRAVTINGAPANGYLRGTRLNDALMPAGAYLYGYGGTDAMTLRWRDAFASL